MHERGCGDEKEGKIRKAYKTVVAKYAIICVVHGKMEEKIELFSKIIFFNLSGRF